MKNSDVSKKYTNKLVRLSDYMDNDEIIYSMDILNRINRRVDEMGTLISNAKTADDAYNGEQAEVQGRPNTRVNVIHPNIEGQVADIVLQEIGMSFQGQEFSDQQYADWARVDAEWTLAHQHDFIYTESTFVRRMLKFGWAYFYIEFDSYCYNNFGIARIDTPAIDRVIIDSKIRNLADFQKADYISIVNNCSKNYAISTYGEDKAVNISYGVVELDEDDIFRNDDYIVDDETSWVMLKVFTKDNNILRCREYDSTGLLLWDSFKGSDKKENQKSNAINEKPLYKYVDNKYPVVMRNCYEREGELNGYGDIKLIISLQQAINDLYDNIRMSTRPRRVLVDSRSDISPEDINEDSFEPLMFAGEELNGNNPTREVDFGNPNNTWWTMIANMHDEIQRILRYSELMLGQSGSATTATQSAIQERQGSRSTSMKQKSIESALRDVITYCLGLSLEFREGKKSMRLSQDNDDMVWVDYDLMKNIPETVPMEGGTIEKYKQAGYNEATMPTTQLKTEGGKVSGRSIALDLKINIGAKSSQSPAVKSQLINQLASLQLLTKDGKVRPVIFWDELRKYMTDEFGLPLESTEKITRGLNEYEEMLKKKEEMAMAQQQQAMELEKATAQQAIVDKSQSAVPQGTPQNIQEPDQRANMGVMQGNKDFTNMQ